MIGAFFLLIFLSLAGLSWISRLKIRYPFLDARLLNRLMAFHFVMTLAYYGYALFNRSDSRSYYRRVVQDARGEGWFDFYGTSTTFIEFIAYPFIKLGGLSYESLMVLFSSFGFIGFVYFYIFFRENIKFRHTLFGYDLLTIIFFLPNLHFWSASLGKGSIIFLGLALFFFGVSKMQSRWIAIVVGGLIVYHVRPHIMLVVLVSTMLGFVFSTRQMSTTWRVIFLGVAIAAFFYIYKDVLTLVGLDEDGLVTQGLDLSSRARELSNASSGVDISQYNLLMQVFTFLYRPLFFDAPGILGYMVSFENIFYLLISFKLISRISGIAFLFTGGFLVKSAFLSFITVSVALAQIAGNLGLAMRQKSQVMILFLFVVLAFLDSEKKKVRTAMRRTPRPGDRSLLTDPVVQV